MAEALPKMVVPAPSKLYAGQVPQEAFTVSVPFILMVAGIAIEPPAPVPLSTVASSLLALFQTVVKGPAVDVPQCAAVVSHVPAPPWTVPLPLQNNCVACSEAAPRIRQRIAV